MTSFCWGIFRAIDVEWSGTRSIETTDHETRIIKNYLKFWFYVDFVASFPVGWFASADNSLRFLRFFRLFRLTKVARLKKIFFQLEGASTVVSWGPYIVAIFRVLLYLTMLGHVGACVWYTVGTGPFDWACVEGDPRTWQCDVDDKSWLSTVEDYQYEHGSWSAHPKNSMYINALYFALATMTTVGYGDIHPKSVVEKIFALIVFWAADMV